MAREGASAARFSSSVHGLITASRWASSSFEWYNAPAIPAAPMTMGRRLDLGGSFFCSSSTDSLIAPPTAPAATSRPALRTDALDVVSSSVSGMRLTASPAAVTTALAPTRTTYGDEEGIARLIAPLTPWPTSSAARTDRAEAIPWLTDGLGIRDGARDANIARVFRGPPGPPRRGLN